MVQVHDERLLLALFVSSCVQHQCDPSASSDHGSPSVFLRPWHRLAPGSEREAA